MIPFFSAPVGFFFLWKFHATALWQLLQRRGDTACANSAVSQDMGIELSFHPSGRFGVSRAVWGSLQCCSQTAANLCNSFLASEPTCSRLQLFLSKSKKR